MYYGDLTIAEFNFVNISYFSTFIMKDGRELLFELKTRSVSGVTD